MAARAVGTREQGVIFWQISFPYFDQGGRGEADYNHEDTTCPLWIFRPSYGPSLKLQEEVRDNDTGFNYVRLLT